MNNRQVAEAWAKGCNRKARNARKSLYCENNIIYSYGSHFPIAKWVCENIVYFTKDRYSCTTTRHKSLVRRCIPSNVLVLEFDKVSEID